MSDAPQLFYGNVSIMLPRPEIAEHNEQRRSLRVLGEVPRQYIDDWFDRIGPLLRTRAAS